MVDQREQIEEQPKSRLDLKLWKRVKKAALVISVSLGLVQILNIGWTCLGKYEATHHFIWHSKSSDDGAELNFVQSGTSFPISSIEIRFPPIIRPEPLELGAGETSFFGGTIESSLRLALAPCISPVMTRLVEDDLPVEVRTKYAVNGKIVVVNNVYNLRYGAWLNDKGLYSLRLKGVGLRDTAGEVSTEALANWHMQAEGPGRCESAVKSA